MIPHINTLFEFISTPYENQHQTLHIKNDRGQYATETIEIYLIKLETLYHMERQIDIYLN